MKMHVYWFNDGTILYINHEMSIPEYIQKSKGHGGLFMYSDGVNCWMYDKTGNEIEILLVPNE